MNKKELCLLLERELLKEKKSSERNFQKLKKLAERDDIHIRFANTEKIGINPGYDYNNPIGVYTYPLKPMWKNVVERDIPFMSGGKFIHVLQENPRANIVDVADKFNEDDYVLKLFQLNEGYYWIVFQNALGEEIVDDVMEKVFEEENLKIPEDVKEVRMIAASHLAEKFSSHPELPMGRLWWVLKEVSRNSKEWAALLLDLGIDAVTDKTGTGLIHDNEPIQAVFIHPKSYKRIELMDNFLTDEDPYHDERKWDQETRDDLHYLKRIIDEVRLGKLKRVGKFFNILGNISEPHINSVWLPKLFTITPDEKMAEFFKQNSSILYDREVKDVFNRSMKTILQTLRKNKMWKTALVFAKQGDGHLVDGDQLWGLIIKNVSKYDAEDQEEIKKQIFGRLDVEKPGRLSTYISPLRVSPDAFMATIFNFAEDLPSPKGRNKELFRFEFLDYRKFQKEEDAKKLLSYFRKKFEEAKRKEMPAAVFGWIGFAAQKTYVFIWNKKVGSVQASRSAEWKKIGKSFDALRHEAVAVFKELESEEGDYL